MHVDLTRLRASLRPVAAAVALAALPAALLTASASAQVAPALQRSAISLGQQQPSAPVTGTVWLQLHNKAALDAAVQAMYTPGSATYQKFQDTAALQQFAPTAAEIASVKQELAAHHLSVVSVDPDNFSIKIQGQISDFEAAFHTSVTQYRMRTGATVSALSAAPALGDSAAGMVRAVTGISGTGLQPFLKHPLDPATGKQMGLVPATGSASPQGVVFSSNCFYSPQTVKLSTPGATLPAAAYSGIVYGASPANTTRGTISPCGYSPQDVYKLAGLNTVYNQGYTGKGQTIAIVDAYGSPTIQSDFASFNTTYGLTPATGSNFQVIQTVPFTATNAGWAEETTLDVEWSHAIAPDAKIALVTTPSNNDDDLQQGVLYAIEHQLANVISNSYGGPELSSDIQTITSWDEICELAAYEGISVNFATGDSGDYFAEEGTTDVSSPADSPYATAVGGTSAAFSPFDGSIVQTGWGTNITQLGLPSGVSDPPLVFGFQGGAGGGISQYFKLPSYQASLHGSGRQLPDVSALADPYTGVEILFTKKGQRYYVLIGGTSLATPIFSAEWALLDQRFGFPLGQAAPYIAQVAPTGAVTDVDAPSTQFAVQGAIADNKGVTSYSAEALAAPETNAGFLGGLYNDGLGNLYDVTFGTDSSLAVGQGWDPVTGFGTLNMEAIFTVLAGAK